MTGENEIAYSALAHGTRVLSSDGDVIGTVERVLDIPDLDLFDGIVVETPDGDRFVDRDQIARITTSAVHCEVTTAEAQNLPVPDSAPTFRADAGPGDGHSLMGRIRRFLGGPRWTRERDED